MSEKYHDPQNRLSRALTLAVTPAELDVIDRKCKELKITRPNLMRTAIEHFIGEKFFRERICEK